MTLSRGCQPHKSLGQHSFSLNIDQDLLQDMAGASQRRVFLKKLFDLYPNFSANIPIEAKFLFIF